MKALKINLKSITASFRDPNTHKFQRSFPLPTPLTVKGLIGAALGIPPEEASVLPVRVSVHLRTNDIEISKCNERGKFTDLWKYLKYKSHVYDTKDIVQRDILYRHDFDIYIISTNEALKLDSIMNAFMYPNWALSLGREDEIVKIKRINMVELVANDVCTVHHTIVPFNIRNFNSKPDPAYIQKFINNNNIRLDPPLIVSIPISLVYSKNKRDVSKIQDFTFIGETPICISDYKEGYKDEEESRNIIFC